MTVGAIIVVGQNHALRTVGTSTICIINWRIMAEAREDSPEEAEEEPIWMIPSDTDDLDLDDPLHGRSQALLFEDPREAATGEPRAWVPPRAWGTSQSLGLGSPPPFDEQQKRSGLGEQEEEQQQPQTTKSKRIENSQDGGFD